jgi:hypothetical protein
MAAARLESKYVPGWAVGPSANRKLAVRCWERVRERMSALSLPLGGRIIAEFERELAHERTMAGLRAARERGRVGGRPRALNEEDVPELQALMKDPDVSTTGICERFDVSKATLYRYVGPNGERRR